MEQEWEELEVEPLPDSHFGLLGTQDWEVPQGSVNDLPAEILRNIFALLPVLDLYQNLSLVCHYWREIIRDPQVRNGLGWSHGIIHALPLFCSLNPLILPKNPGFFLVSCLFYFGLLEQNLFYIQNPHWSHPWKKKIWEMPENPT